MTEEPKHLYELTLPNGETLEVWRLPQGGVVGIDSTFLEQVEDVIQDPYNVGTQHRLIEPGKDFDAPDLIVKPNLWGAPAPGLHELMELQTCDEGLWFEAETAPEAYLQQELRKLHDKVEDVLRLLRDNTHDNVLEEHLERFGKLECVNGTPACWNCIENALAEEVGDES